VRFDSLFQDIRYAGRILRRAPGFAATVVATMGMGLGLLGSAFTLVNAYLLKPIDLWLPKTRSDVAGCTGLTRARLHTGDARTTTTPHTSKSPSPRTSRQVSASCGDRRG
jgi:hypothetical protein